VIGPAIAGAMLTATTGEWSGAPTSYGYQWLACEAGGACVEIPEATAPTYTVIAPEVGYTLRVLITATGAGGSQTEVSEETATIGEAPPANIVLPQIAGPTLKGAKLTASTGEWSGSPTSYAYEWQSCDPLGTCTKIEGARSSTLALTAADVGHTIRVVVTATGPGGSQTATSEETATISEPPPPPTLNLSLPKITGTTTEGQKLTASTGEWSGSPTSYAYEWQSCGPLGTCVKIEGATSSAHTLTAADVGHAIRVLVTATGPGGSKTATSEETATISEPASSTPTDCIDNLAACGYPDPTSTNVGPGVPCSSLTPAGETTITKSGTTIQDEDITGQVTIDASNVTLTHDCITNNGGAEAGSAVVIVEAAGVGAQIDYSDISGENTTSGSVEEAIRTNSSTAHTTADHDHLFNCGECFHGAGTLTNSYVISNAEINPGQSDEDHYEDIYDGGGGGPLIVDHNTMLNPHQQTAVVFASVDFGNQTTLTITNNLIAGGDYVLYGGGSGSSGTVVGPVTVSGNRFSRIYYELGGSVGVATYFNDSVTSWSGNTWDETLEPVEAP
jgi:hypothetical protein